MEHVLVRPASACIEAMAVGRISTSEWLNRIHWVEKGRHVCMCIKVMEAGKRLVRRIAKCMPLCSTLLSFFSLIDLQQIHKAHLKTMSTDEEYSVWLKQ